MKKFTLIILAVAFVHSLASSQGCLPEGITFTTQTQVDSFQFHYPGCKEIEGDVTISGGISNLNGLNVLTSFGGNLTICGTNLTSLSGLDGVTLVAGNFRTYCGSGWGLTGNYWLTSLAGLGALASVEGSLEIGSNPILSDISALDNLTTVGGDLTIYNADSLTSISGLNNLTTVGGNLSIDDNHDLTDVSGFNSLTSTGNGFTIIASASLTIVSGFSSLTSVGGDFIFTHTGTLTIISGFNALTTITGTVSLGALYSVTSITGLNALTNIGGSFVLSNNQVLTNLPGLSNLITIGGGLYITYNAVLPDISGLNSVTSIGGHLYIYDNSALTSLIGLNNIDTNSITSLFITGNSVLSNCAVQSICDYLVSPNATIDIYNNAPGCNSPEEVLEACATVSVENMGIADDYFIFPNPADKTLTISIKNKEILKEVNIYNLTGKRVQHGKPVNNTLDISKLKPGMYIIELINNQWKVREKLIVI